MKMIITSIKTSILAFKEAPMVHLLATLFLVLGIVSGIFTGVAMMAYFWFLSRAQSFVVPPFSPFMGASAKRIVNVMQFSQHLAGRHRLFTMSVLGMGMWLLLFISAFGFHHRFLGTPICWYFCQPLILMMMIVDAYDVDLKIAAKTMVQLFRLAPQTAGTIVVLNFLAIGAYWLSEIPLGGVERYLSFLTLIFVPLAWRSAGLYFRASAMVVNKALQKAYE